MKSLWDTVQEAVGAIRREYVDRPEVAIVLGTGLGGLTEEIEASSTMSFDAIPHFPKPTVATHAGTLVLGKFAGKKVVAMDGRFHYYEGYSMQQVTLPVRVARELGAETLVVSNAAGGMNPQFRAGDIIIIEDHINLMGDNPLIGPNDERLGPRYPDMCEPYDKTLIELAEAVALENRIRAHTGVYVAVAGPNLETRAEYRFLRAIGADIVGMSTVPEVIVAAHSAMRVLGLSVITDNCLPDALEPADIESIIKIANEAEPKLRLLVKETIRRL